MELISANCFWFCLHDEAVSPQKSGISLLAHIHQSSALSQELMLKLVLVFEFTLTMERK
jgi:hypothetical protein